MATFSSKAEARRVFEDYFRTAHRKANGYLYYLPSFAPYTYDENRRREEEERIRDEEERRKELKDMQRKAAISEKDPESPSPNRGPPTPRLEDLSEIEHLLERRMEFVYLPEYRNLYVLRQLQRMPTLLQVGKVYNDLPQSVKPKVYMNYERDKQLENIVEGLMRLLRQAKQNIARKYVPREFKKWWVGDGRFTGYANCLYALKQVGPQQYKLIQNCVFEDKDVLQYIQLTNLLHKAKLNIGGYREKVIMQLRAQEVVSQIQSYQAPRRWTERRPPRRGRGRQRRRDDRKGRDDRGSRGQGRPNKRQRRRLEAAEFQALLKF